MRVICSLALLLVMSAAGAQSQSQSAAPAESPVVEEVLVTGEQPGPGLWKATKSGKTLWILGTYAPLPEKMTWRAREVESIISESRRVVRWVNIETDLKMGFFAKLSALRALATAGRNPGGAKLKDVVSPEAYAQWQALKAKYNIGRDEEIEDLRPALAAVSLRYQATKAVGLSSPDDGSVVWPTVRDLAKKHKAKVVEPTVTMELKIDKKVKPSAAIKKFSETQLPDMECFTQTLARLESDLEEMKVRANAWATGDVDALRQIPPPDPATDCAQLLQNLVLSGSLEAGMGDAREAIERTRMNLERAQKEAGEVWVRTIDEALRDRPSVLATVPISYLFEADGPLKVLRAHGYTVDEP